MLDRVAFQFVTESDPLSATIRWFSRSDVSHVDLVLPNGNLLGARFVGGVAVRKPDYAPWSRVARVELVTPCAEKIIAAAMTQRDRPYDWRAIAAFAFDRNWRETDSWICSELQAWALEVGGFFREKLVVPVSRITPGDLLLLLSSYATVSWLRGAP